MVILSSETIPSTRIMTIYISILPSGLGGYSHIVLARICLKNSDLQFWISKNVHAIDLFSSIQ